MRKGTRQVDRQDTRPAFKNSFALIQLCRQLEQFDFPFVWRTWTTERSRFNVYYRFDSRFCIVIFKISSIQKARPHLLLPPLYISFLFSLFSFFFFFLAQQYETNRWMLSMNDFMISGGVPVFIRQFCPTVGAHDKEIADVATCPTMNQTRSSFISIPQSLLCRSCWSFAFDYFPCSWFGGGLGLGFGCFDVTTPLHPLESDPPPFDFSITPDSRGRPNGFESVIPTDGRKEESKSNPLSLTRGALFTLHPTRSWRTTRSFHLPTVGSTTTPETIPSRMTLNV